MIRRIRGIFLKGLLAVVPLVITLYVVYWSGIMAERYLGGLLKTVVPSNWYWPGMGVGSAALGVFAAGLLMNHWLIDRLFRRFETLMDRIPLIKTLYGSIRDTISFATAEQTDQFGSVVCLDVPEVDGHVIGFLTRENLGDLKGKQSLENRVAVFVPMSYQLGGFTFIVPPERVHRMDITREEGLKFALTAGVKGNKPPESDTDG